MGRLPEGFEELGRCRHVAQEDDASDFSVCVYALFASAEAHYHAHDADAALACASQAEEITSALGAPAQHVALTQFAFAYAHLAAGRAEDAIESARAAVDSFAHVDKATAGLSASLLAEALLQAGDLPAAQTAAAEAIALCRRQLAPPHGVMARVLLRREGAAARDAVEALLARAAALIERTGARTLAPALCEWRAELAAVLGDDVTRQQLLREAEHLYQEIGAPLQVERLVRELAS